ncbi:uncharacterized mitochondrial protein AtMg00310-like [Humulus lupulus]|uniref:uncharacterized mitochondrial protein AtMg00310-like n=1 Tax=Humulus lupulus TaxID=3486 RepID=UPI002B413562|nr:uncharacterized mitochondrial protein AtMg00310-like [Humulus lupulus]
MICFKFPMKLINDPHRMAARFWWGSSEKKKKIHWCKLTKLCMPKERGLGFMDLSNFNQSWLAKQMWRIIRNPNSLCRNVLKASYFPNKSIVEASCDYKASYVWRSFMWEKEIILSEYKWRIGDGNDVRVLQGPWLPRLVSFSAFEKLHLPNDLFVIDLKKQNGERVEKFILNNFCRDDSELTQSE